MKNRHTMGKTIYFGTSNIKRVKPPYYEQKDILTSICRKTIHYAKSNIMRAKPTQLYNMN